MEGASSISCFNKMLAMNGVRRLRISCTGAINTICGGCPHLRKDGKAKQMIANWLYRRVISVSDGGFRKV